MDQVELLKKHIKSLWNVVFFLTFLTIISLVLAVVNSGNKMDYSYVDNRVDFKLSEQNDKLKNQNDNIIRLFRNDSIIVAAQHNYQDNQNKKDFLSFLFKML